MVGHTPDEFLDKFDDTAYIEYATASQSKALREILLDVHRRLRQLEAPPTKSERLEVVKEYCREKGYVEPGAVANMFGMTNRTGRTYLNDIDESSDEFWLDRDGELTDPNTLEHTPWTEEEFEAYVDETKEIVESNPSGVGWGIVESHFQEYDGLRESTATLATLTLRELVDRDVIIEEKNKSGGGPLEVYYPNSGNT